MSSSAQPSTDYSGQSVTHEVELPDDDSSVSSDNFSSIQLSCVYDMSSGPQSEGIGAKFKLNGTDIKEEIDEVEDINGTVHFVLTPEKEGFFTCSLNGSLSINTIGLAGTCVPCLKLVSFCVIHSSAQY